MTAPLIQLAGVQKRYGDVVVLDGIDLDVRAGEVLGVIGPSGAGKSTLLRVVNQLERHDRGSLMIDGERIDPHWGNRRLARIRGKVGMVFQSFNLWPHLSVRQNVALAPRLVLRMTRDEASDRATALLDRVGLAGHADKYPGQLSGGQQQRVAIARALGMRPRVMLFDEATSALDPALVGEVLDVMADLAAGGMTMLVVTHEMRFARRVSSRILFMADGRIAEDASPGGFFDAPKTSEAKAFLKHILR